MQTKQGSPARIALIGFGEAASAFVEGWRKAVSFEAQAFDIKTADPSEAVRAAKWQDYSRWGVSGAGTPAVALAGAGIVFSLVTADQALAAAQSAAPHLEPGAFYFDCNSCSPGTKRSAAEAITHAGGRYIDTAVMAPVRPKLHKTPLLVSGPDAEQALAVTRALDMAANAVPGGVGAASSNKMIRSVMVKGLEALVLECVLAGRKAGVDEAVLDSLEATFPGFGWKKRSAYMMERAGHAWHTARSRDARSRADREGAGLRRRDGLRHRGLGAENRRFAASGGGCNAGDGQDYGALADLILRRLDDGTIGD